MKSIKLAEEHKSKLLEMCKALFPEHKFGFGDFPTSEVGAEYVGLDYLDVTHINHKIPCIKSRFEIKEDTSDLKIVTKDAKYPEYDLIEYGFVDNISGDHNFFTKNGDIIKQGDYYEEVYIEGIHWFEFCMTTLAKKILYNLHVPKNSNSEEGGQIAMEEFGNNILYLEKHPIDYLYQKFKKLRNES